MRRLHHLLGSRCSGPSCIVFELEGKPTVLVHFVHVFRDLIACNIVFEDDDVSARESNVSIGYHAIVNNCSDEWCGHDDTYPSTWDMFFVFLSDLVWVVLVLKERWGEDRNTVSFALK